MIKTIQDLKTASSFNKEYFSKANKIFFNDIDYKLLTRKKTKEKYLITQTWKFTKIFSNEQKITFVIKPISKSGEISTRSLDFQTLKEVKKYLRSK